MESRNPFAQPQPRAQAVSYDAGLRKFMLGVYNYMASALALTGVVALVTAQTPALIGMFYQINEAGQIVGAKPLGIAVAFAPLVYILVLMRGFQNMSIRGAQLTFWSFAVVMGLSMASIFLLYTGESVARVFFISAGMFGGMSLYGYTTKRDLTRFGSFLFMGAWGLMLAMLVNWIWPNPGLYMAISVIGVFVFLGLTAHNTQQLKSIYYHVAGNAEAATKASISGALSLYLDFINLFMMLLRLVGERR